MKKHIALTTGVEIATKKVKPYTNVKYGVDITWEGSECNFHQAPLITDPQNADHTESSLGNTATVSVTADPGERGFSHALVGVTWKWHDLTEAQWEQIKNKPVTVTIDATYNATVAGGDPWAKVGIVLVGTEPEDYPLTEAFVWKTGTYTERKTTAFNTTFGYIGNMGGYSAASDDVTFWLGAFAWSTLGNESSTFAITQHTWGNVTIHSISIHYVS